MLKLVLLMVTAITLVGCTDSETNQKKFIGNNKDLEIVVSNGEKVYNRNCKVCHGSKGDVNVGGSLNLKETVLDRVEITTIIKLGRRGMPSFRNKIKDDEIEDVVSFVLSFNSSQNK